MTRKGNDFAQRLLATFRAEADDHIKAMASGLIELEKATTADRQQALVESIFREAHSLKGAARAVTQREIEALCQSLEDVFAALKRQEIGLSPPLFDQLHRTIAVLSDCLRFVHRGLPAPVAQEVDEAQNLLREILGGHVVSHAPPPGEGVERVMRDREGTRPSLRDAPGLSETVRVTVGKLDRLFRWTEELLAAKLAASDRVEQLRETVATFHEWRRAWAQIEPVLRTLGQDLANRSAESDASGRLLAAGRLIEFLQWSNAFVAAEDRAVTTLLRRAEQDQRALARMVDGLLEETRGLLMFPFASLLETFPPLVRDLARDRGKEIDLIIRGADIEVDRRILQEIKDPLVHLIRNGIDHGIERPDVRRERGKPERGRLTIAVEPADGHEIEVVVADDGTGIDLAIVRRAAVALGRLSEEEAARLDEAATLSLIFESGISTSPVITEVSGRGLGLTIVREKVEALGGSVAVQTRRGEGTTFRLRLPITVATFRGVIVRVHDQLLVIPTRSVQRLVRVNLSDVKTVENRETISVNGEPMSLVRLADVLGLPSPPLAGDESPLRVAVILASGDQRMAFLVDEVVREQEVVAKPLGPLLERVRTIAGAAVLGSGQAVPVLHVGDALAAARRGVAEPRPAAPRAPEGEERKEKKSILVVEDSITARMLLKSILEAAGYRVATAVDGIDAFTQLRTEDFDLVVSDVDMPRLNGFDLTARIRRDKRLANLPVILVTALESQADRERGIDVGADAYLVKSRFDQSHLLEVIRRLL